MARRKRRTFTEEQKANCWDNAVMESFFGSNEQEWADHHSYSGLVEARLSAQGYIKAFYNRRRLHSSLGYRPPAEVDAEWATADRLSINQREES